MGTRAWIAAPSFAFLIVGAGVLGPRSTPDLPAISLPSLSAIVAETTEADLSPGALAEGEEFRPELPAPTRIEIPAIGVNAVIESRGKGADGKMEDPEEWRNVAWYSPGPAPGEQGRAVFAGHLDSKTAPAVFYDIVELEPGDEVIFTDEEGVKRTFYVTQTQRYETADAPVRELFSRDTPPEIVLITCGGTWNAVGGYDERIVVYGALTAPVKDSFAITPSA